MDSVKLLTPYDLIGRKAIMAALDVRDWGTVLARLKMGAPIIRRVDGKWAASSIALSEWLGREADSAGLVSSSLQ